MAPNRQLGNPSSGAFRVDLGSDWVGDLSLLRIYIRSSDSQQFWWFLMISYDFWWFLMISDGFRWFLMISYDFWWFLMVSDDFWWFHMISDDFWWFLMVSDDFWWFLMISYDFWWFLMVSDDFWCLKNRQLETFPVQDISPEARNKQECQPLINTPWLIK